MRARLVASFAVLAASSVGGQGIDSGVSRISSSSRTGFCPLGAYQCAGVPPVGTLLKQYTYEPCASVIVAENLDLDANGASRHALNRVGFQGLFFEAAAITRTPWSGGRGGA